MRRWMRMVVVLTGVLVVSVVVAPGGARADGNCGRHDDSGPTACPIDGAGAYTGSLTPQYDPYPQQTEQDYFVFHAKAGTALDVTVHDDSDPQCDGGTGYLAICGIVSVQLLDGGGNQIAYNHDLGATFNDAVAVPAILDHTIRRAGTYYLVLYGSLNHIISGTYTGPNLLPVPYTVDVSATPNVFWPAHCTVPHVKRHESLAVAKRFLTNNGCHVGRISRRAARRTPRGDVVAFSSPGGRVFPHNTRIGIVIARR